MKTVNLTGEVFGRLEVISFAGHSSSGCRQWKCKCVCGNIVVVIAKNLRKGNTKSCGCFKLDRVITHGACLDGKVSRSYGTWRSMKQRCYNPKCNEYHNYGFRGVVMCERWLGEDGFIHFLSDMGEKPKGLTLERINNNGNYGPDNCKWATQKEQNSNKRTNRLTTYKGETKTTTQWSEVIGCNKVTLAYRLNNWSIERALTTPIKGR